MNSNRSHYIWHHLLRADLDTLQAIARQTYSRYLTVRDGVTYLNERDADYGVDDFDDLYRLRDWLYYRMTNQTEGDAFMAAWNAAQAEKEQA